MNLFPSNLGETCTSTRTFPNALYRAVTTQLLLTIAIRDTYNTLLGGSSGGQSVMARALEVSILAAFLCAPEAPLTLNAIRHLCFQHKIGKLSCKREHCLLASSRFRRVVISQPAVSTVLRSSSFQAITSRLFYKPFSKRSVLSCQHRVSPCTTKDVRQGPRLIPLSGKGASPVASSLSQYARAEPPAPCRNILRGVSAQNTVSPSAGAVRVQVLTQRPYKARNDATQQSVP